MHTPPLSPAKARSLRYVANTSGDRSRAIPLQAQGGSWGAFMFSGLWALCNRIWIGALCFLPALTLLPLPRVLQGMLWFVAVITWGYLTLCGRTLAWTRKRWPSYEQFHQVQGAWALAAKSLFVTALALAALAWAALGMLGAGLSHMNG